MTFKIHFVSSGVKDSVILTGENIDEIRDKAKIFTAMQGIDESTCWSEEL